MPSKRIILKTTGQSKIGPDSQAALKKSTTPQTAAAAPAGAAPSSTAKQQSAARKAEFTATTDPARKAQLQADQNAYRAGKGKGPAQSPAQAQRQAQPSGAAPAASASTPLSAKDQSAQRKAEIARLQAQPNRSPADAQRLVDLQKQQTDYRAGKGAASQASAARKTEIAATTDPARRAQLQAEHDAYRNGKGKPTTGQTAEGRARHPKGQGTPTAAATATARTAQEEPLTQQKPVVSGQVCNAVCPSNRRAKVFAELSAWAADGVGASETASHARGLLDAVSHSLGDLAAEMGMSVQQLLRIQNDCGCSGAGGADGNGADGYFYVRNDENKNANVVQVTKDNADLREKAQRDYYDNLKNTHKHQRMNIRLARSDLAALRTGKAIESSSTRALPANV